MENDSLSTLASVIVRPSYTATKPSLAIVLITVPAHSGSKMPRAVHKDCRSSANGGERPPFTERHIARRDHNMRSATKPAKATGASPQLYASIWVTDAKFFARFQCTLNCPSLCATNIYSSAKGVIPIRSSASKSAFSQQEWAAWRGQLASPPYIIL